MIVATTNTWIAASASSRSSPAVRRPRAPRNTLRQGAGRPVERGSALAGSAIVPPVQDRRDPSTDPRRIHPEVAVVLLERAVRRDEPARDTDRREPGRH